MKLSQLIQTPFVAARLIFTLVLTLLKLLWGLYPTQILASTTLVFALILTVVYLQIVGLSQPQLPFLDTSNLRAQREHWLQIAEQYPTHRDVLINLALIEDRLQNTEAAQDYWERARRQDPNANYFVTHALSSQKELTQNSPTAISQQ